MEVDSGELADGEFVTVYGDAGARGDSCPRCHCERIGWDCLGCDWQFTEEWIPTSKHP